MPLRRNVASPARTSLTLGLAVATVAAVSVAGSGAAFAAPASRSAAPISRSTSVDVVDGSEVRLTADVIPNLAKLVPTGPAPASQFMQAIVAIVNPNHDAAVAYESAISNPSSPDYRHFLTPDDYGARFGVPARQTTDTESRLKASGLRIDAVTAAGDAITTTGTVAEFEHAFDVSEMAYSSNGRTFIANTSGPLTWSADHVFTVIGLDTLQSYATPQQQVADLKLPTSTGKLSSGVASPDYSTTQVGAEPIDSSVSILDKLYDLPTSATGKGQRLTVIGEGDPSSPISDLRTFETQNGLPVVPVTVDCVDKNAAGAADCGTDTAGNGEWDIDFQASTSMAPDIDGLTLDFSQSLGDTDLDNAFLSWINDPNGSKQASASEGVCEQTPLNPVTDANTPVNSNETEGTGEALGDNQEPVIDWGLLQAAIEGRTLFASTGDTGATCGAIIIGPIGAGNGLIYNGIPSVDYPAASAYATAVGGTEIYNSGTTAVPSYFEEAWEYSGGGPSMYIAAGDYALANTHSAGICLSSPDGSTGNTGKQCRGSADVSAQSGGLLDGFPIISDGQASSGAGTSLAAPLWQGMWARLQSGAAPSIGAGGFGFADETIYKLAYNSTTYARDFHDVVTGTNPLPTLTGWDYPTGWGTPDIGHLLADANLEGPQTVTAALPEAPAVPLLVLPVLLAAAGALVVRRRRQSTSY